jgi:uncharacterized protein DUF6328
MTSLSDKIKTAIDESRMLILGTQVLLGFQYRAFFEKGFEALPPASQYLELAGLAVLLLAIALIMWPSAYHRIVRKGNDANDVHEFATGVMDVALLPFGIALVLDFYVLSGKVLGKRGGIIMAALIGAISLAFWFGYGFIVRARQRRRRSRPSENHDAQRTQEGGGMEKTPIHKKVEQVLTEARVVLPGAQALMGFQFATILMEAFDKLPLSSKYIHLISLTLMGVSVILLMTPAAYHRIVERGEDTERFHDVASRLLVASMITLPIGICGDLFVVMRKMTETVLVSLVSSLIMLGVFYGLWFGFTIYRRSRTA